MKKNYLLLLGMLVLTYSFIVAQPTKPNAPIAFNSNNCTPALSETCSGGSTVVTCFTGATLRSGSPTSLPALYTFYNVATVSGQQINATVTIDAASNVDMTGTNFSIDDDDALDQANNPINIFFAPRITPADNLTTSDVRGYVQFTIRFYMENGTAGQQYPQDYTTPPPFGGLSGLNYIHYDIDGSEVGTGGWFRETGLIQNVTGSVINANAPTELVSYAYTDGCSWKGFAGSVGERTGVSRCAETAVAANFSAPQTQITFRMGYDYEYNGTSFNSQPTRQYGSRFGCFSFPQPSTLPVRILSFTGTYKNNTALLNWSAENEVNFDSYEIERSVNGTDFGAVGGKPARGVPSSKQQYNYTDDLSSIKGNVFYYRLKMIDIDGQVKYSNIILLRKDQKQLPGITISPNPVVSGNSATVRFETTKSGIITFNVIDMSGKIVSKQQNNVAEGTNSIAITNLDRLQPGIYVLQMNDGSTTNVAKFTIAR